MGTEELRQLLPTVNAILNSISAVLLVIGWVTVKRRWIAVHKACMLAALAVSGLFLASYLYYHFALQDPELSRFRGEGWIRPAYFVILISHVVLAIVVTPLALVTAYLGLRDRLTNHVRIARWTMPLWLYVSVTGVIVYLMLYRLYPLGG
jgi:putative membrane protein